MSVEGLAAPALDPIARLHVLAAAIPGSGVIERTLDAPLDDVWAAATDFEGTVPRFERFVRSATIVSRDGERLVVDVRAPLGIPDRLEIVLRRGWCLMQGRRSVVVMAAVEDGGRTRFAHLEAFRVPGGRFLAGVLRWKMRISRELEGIEREARRRRAWPLPSRDADRRGPRAP